MTTDLTETILIMGVTEGPYGLWEIPEEIDLIQRVFLGMTTCVILRLISAQRRDMETCYSGFISRRLGRL